MIKKKKSFFYLKPLSPTKLKLACISLGASFVKLAQVLATRADFFTQEYLDELKELHDQLPSMKQNEFEAIFKRNFTSETFKSFDKNPIASASIGQVHVGYLDDDTKVAVKLRRVDIKEQVYADINIISFFNKIFKPLFSHYTKNSIEAVIVEFSKMIKQEVSLTNELNNLLKFSSIYKDSGVKFPKAFPEYCSDEVVVMSFEEGFRFDDKESIFKHNIDFKKIITTLVDFYTTQMLINGYFHADPHPGNLLVNTQGELILLDFGMVKSVPNDTRVAIIELIKSANEQDYDGYISANKRLGTIAYEAPTAQLAEFTQKMFEIFSNDNLDSESMQKLAFEVLESTRDFPFKLPSDAIYILRVSAIIEGLGTTYIENFNGVKDILPILKTNIPKALGANDSIKNTLAQELKDIPFTVKHFKSSLKQISEGELNVQVSNSQLLWIAKEVKHFAKPIINGFAFMLAGFFVLSYDSNLSSYAITLFIIGFVRVLYK
ncbi:MAG: AarF/UbiB family protein [Arcobacteraceae bacterium]